MTSILELVRFRNVSLCLLALFGNTTCSWADTSADLARKGRSVLSAYTCSYYASLNEKAGESTRLFEYGYSEGKGFLEAANAGKIDEEDIRSTVPMLVSMVSQGPNIDFVLGRLYQEAIDEADKKINVELEGTDLEGWKKLRNMKASNEYQHQNCALLGQ